MTMLGIKVLCYRLLSAKVILFLFSLPIYAQRPVLPDTMDSTRLAAVDYLITNGEISIYDRNEYLRLMPIYDIVTSSPLKFDAVGIYSFKSFNSPSVTYLILSGQNAHEVLNPKNLDVTLSEVILFLRRHGFDESSTLKYVEGVLSVYKGNRYGSRSKM